MLGGQFTLRSKPILCLVARAGSGRLTARERAVGRRAGLARANRDDTKSEDAKMLAPLAPRFHFAAVARFRIAPVGWRAHDLHGTRRVKRNLR